MISMLESYDKAVNNGEIKNDCAQRSIIPLLQRLADDFLQAKRSLFPWWRKRLISGVYLYGPVGAGKTFLIDLFFDYVDEPCKARFHFHHFMQQIDAQLRRLQGQKDPLKRIVKELAKTTRLLCFDEFLVEDVAHAMILGELLEAFFASGITVVATSNVAPDNLYLKGVQRQRFLAAIALINRNCEVLQLRTKADYRLGRAPLTNAYFFPLNSATDLILNQQFAAISQGAIQEQGFLTVQNREIPFVKCSSKAVWFEFNKICNLPRSQLDYLEIADRFETIFVSNLPKLTQTVNVILLVNFIDVIYDRGLSLVLSAALPLEELYTQGEMLVTFQRTLSRLQEMQAEDYQRRHPRRQLQELLTLKLKD